MNTWRAMIPFALAAAVCAAAPARAVEYSEKFESDSGSYTALFQNGDITIDDKHTFDFDEEWNLFGFILDDNGALTHDTVLFGLTTQHKEAPHDEGPSTLYTWADFVDSDKEDPLKILEIYGVVKAEAHEEHVDILTFRGIFKMVHDEFGFDMIRGYILSLHGVHTDDPHGCVGMDGQSLKDDLLGASESEAYGNTSLCVDAATGLGTIAMAINEMPIANLVAVELRAGAPGQQGPVILDLGGPSEWTDQNGVNVSRVIEGAAFPQQYLGSLLSGQVYVLVRSLDYPDGAIRGQLHVLPFAASPSSFTAVRGQVVRGQVADLGTNDDRSVVVAKGRGAAPVERVQVEFAGWTPETSPTSVRLVFEGSATVEGLTQTLRLYNVGTGSFEDVDTRAATTTDSRVVVDVTGDPGRFVAADGAVRGMVGYSGPGAGRNWRARIDMVRWEIGQ